MSSEWPRPISVPTSRTIGWFVPEGGAASLDASGERPRIRASQSGAPGRASSRQSGLRAQDAGPTVAATGKSYDTSSRTASRSSPRRIGWRRASPSRDTSWPARCRIRPGNLASPPSPPSWSRAGTPTHTAADLADRIDFLGATTLHPGRAGDGRDHGPDADRAFRRRPRTPRGMSPESHVPRRRSSQGPRPTQRPTLDREAEDPRVVAQREFFAQLFPPDHPLHRNPAGNREDLDAITPRRHRPVSTKNTTARIAPSWSWSGTAAPEQVARRRRASVRRLEPRSQFRRPRGRPCPRRVRRPHVRSHFPGSPRPS